MLHKVLKLHPIIAVSTLSYVYILSGLLVNALQLLIFIFIRSVSERWGTRLNGFLQTAHVAIFTFVSEWHCGCKVRLFASPRDMESFNKEHALCILNHRGEVDWLFGYVLLERLGGLRGCKSMVKKEVKYLPVVGWFMWFTDYLFMSRDWKVDQANIAKQCKIWSNYDPMILSNFYILCAEGTRFTSLKHAASVKFCEERGMKPFRNLLCPRTKGAGEVIKQLGTSLGAVYSVTMAFPGATKPCTGTMFSGVSTEVDMHLTRIGEEDIPKEDEQSKFVMDIFRDKDDLLDYHAEHASFPGEVYPMSRQRISLVMFYLWSCVTLIPSALCLWFLVCNHCYNVLVCIAIGFLAVGVAARKIISMSTLKESSSNGTEKLKQL